MPTLPDRTQLVALGASWTVIQATAVAPVVALPTTTSQVTIWNGAPDGGPSLIIDSVILFGVVSAAAATALSIVGHITNGRRAAPTGTALTATSLSGKAGTPRWGQVTLVATVVDTGWHPIGKGVEAAAASGIGCAVDNTTYGLYIIPPGGAFSISAAANTVTTITNKIGLRWHEYQLTLGQG